MRFVEPKTFLIGNTVLDKLQLSEYLKYSDNTPFKDELLDYLSSENSSEGMSLCSFYAKLCYKSLSLGKNDNIFRVRSIEDNLKSIIKTGHGSVLEHCWLNWITTDCSRVFTHELVRHRVGTAFSQTSGRYVALEKIDFISDPLLYEAEQEIRHFLLETQDLAKDLRDKLITENMDFATKKKITSAIRRIAPNGQANEIGWSCNVRSLRHLIELRTSRHAEREIRLIFNQVADIIISKWPIMLHGHTVEMVDGFNEYKGLHV